MRSRWRSNSPTSHPSARSHASARVWSPRSRCSIRPGLLLDRPLHGGGPAIPLPARSRACHARRSAPRRVTSRARTASCCGTSTPTSWGCRRVCHRPPRWTGRSGRWPDGDSPARRCTRDQAIGLLWPDKPEAAARQSLREAIRLLRRYIGEERLRTEADQLELAAGAVELDTDLLDRLIERRDWAGATPLVRGKFADGFGLDGSSAFEDWLHAEQWHWYGREMDVLIQHAEQRLDAGDLLGADDPARRALNLDPESQRALRTLLRRLALAGDRSAALELYTRFEKRAQQSGAQIEPATQALVDRLRRAREWKLPPAAHTAEQGIAWRRVPLLGREHELAAILSAWRQVRPGRLALVMIEAAPGGGKTRLVEEVMARAALDGGVCIATRAVPADQHQDMSGIVALARGGLLDAPGIAATSPAALAA